MDSLLGLDPLDLVYSPVGQIAYLFTKHACRYVWRYSKMTFHGPCGVDPLPAHAHSLRLLRSEVFPGTVPTTNNATGIVVLKDDAQPVSSWIRAKVFRRINLEDYLSHGLSIVSRLPDLTRTTTQFVSREYAYELAQEAFRAIFDLGNIYCGEGMNELSSVTAGNPNGVRLFLEAAVGSHVGRAVSLKLIDIIRKVAAEYDAMATVLSFDEAAAFLFSRFTGNGGIVTLAKLLLRTGSLLQEDSRNLWVVKRGLDSSMRWFSFLWSDAVVEARRFIDFAKETINAEEELREIDFWGLVDRISNVIVRPRIPLDAVVAVALAELGIVLNCQQREVVSVLRAIAGESAQMTTQTVDVSNPGSVWVAPFRALTRQRLVMALDGRTKLRMVDDISGLRGTLPVYEKIDCTENKFLCCEALPYAHVDEIKSTTPKAFAALAKDGEPWNDGLEKKLLYLSSLKVPPDGIEVDNAVRIARESYVRNNVLAYKYVRIIFSASRIISVYTLAVEQGRRMGDVLYQYSLFMVHPDVSRVGSQRLREVWDNLETVPVGLRRFIENVRLSYEGWMVYPETGSAGVRCVRRRYTNRYYVWMGYARPGVETQIDAASVSESTGGAPVQMRTKDHSGVLPDSSL